MSKKKLIVVLTCIVAVSVGAILGYSAYKKYAEKKAEDEVWLKEEKLYSKLQESSHEQDKPKKGKEIWHSDGDDTCMEILDIPEVDKEVEFLIDEYGTGISFEVWGSEVLISKSEGIKELDPNDYDEGDTIEVDMDYISRYGGLLKPGIDDSLRLAVLSTSNGNLFFLNGDTSWPVTNYSTVCLQIPVKSVYEVKTCDYNSDGVTDIYVSGTDNSGMDREWYLKGVVADAKFGRTTIKNVFHFEEDKSKSDFVMDKYKSYQEAYSDIVEKIEAYQGRSYERKYDLIYFDEDECPELVVDDCSRISMYTFKEGMLDCIFDGWNGVESAYMYSPRNGCIEYTGEKRWADVEASYRTFFILKDGKLIDYSNTDYANEDHGYKDEYYSCMDNLSGAPAKEVFDECNQYDYEYLNADMQGKDILKALDADKYKVKKLEGSEAKFSVDGQKYTLRYREIDKNKRQFSLSNKNNLNLLKATADNHQAYLFSRDNGRAFLYLFVLTDKPTSKLYIYDLCDGDIKEPILYNGEFSLYNGEIKRTDYFYLQCPETRIIDSAVQRVFYINYFGMPEANDAYADYISAESLVFGNKIKGGETFKLNKDTTFINDDYDLVELKKGEVLTLDKIEYCDDSVNILCKNSNEEGLYITHGLENNDVRKGDFHK